MSDINERIDTFFNGRPATTRLTNEELQKAIEVAHAHIGGTHEQSQHRPLWVKQLEGLLAEQMKRATEHRTVERT